MPHPHCLAAILFAAAAAAQTFVVDANNGPGANFTSLATATAAAPDGAVLLVRAGVYSDPFSISAKSLTILADTGAELRSMAGPMTVQITSLAPTQTVVIRNFQVAAAQSGSLHVSCANNQGKVLLEGMRDPLGIGPTSFGATSCSAVVLQDCAFSGPCNISDSVAALSDCSFSPSIFGFAYLWQTNGQLHLAGCSIHSNGQPAVTINGGTLCVSGASLLQGGGFAGPVIGGSGTLRIAPSVTLQGAAPQVAPAIGTTIVDMPSLTLAEVAPAGTVQASLPGPIGHAAFVLVALPSLPYSLPFFVEAVWLDPLVVFVLGAGVPAPGTPVTAALSMPAVSSTVGFIVAWQGITLDAVVGFQISNPEFSIVH